MQLPDDVYAKLLAVRTALRRFERWSEQQAQAAGLTPAQHQLLLAIRGHGDPRGPTIGEVASYLLLRHHSAVGLIDRAEAAGLVVRERAGDDHRVVRMRLTRRGARRLDTLSALHVEELARLAPQLSEARLRSSDRISQDDRRRGARAARDEAWHPGASTDGADS
jgi:DNA-binding MarR family transcriptional regulator